MPELVSHKKPWIPKKKKSDNKSWAYDSRYHTQAWRRYRKFFLMDNPLCVECKKTGKIVKSTTVGHIIPVSQDNSDNNFWDSKNHKALCTSCNNRQAQTDKHDK